MLRSHLLPHAARWQFHVRLLVILVALSAVAMSFLRSCAPSPEYTRDASWPARCPKCGAPGVAKLVHGYLADEIPRVDRALKNGIIAPGGCGGGGPGDPKWRCNRCAHEWGGTPETSTQ